jgi:hypothetical protein
MQTSLDSKNTSAPNSDQAAIVKVAQFFDVSTNDLESDNEFVDEKEEVSLAIVLKGLNPQTPVSK